MRKLLALIFVGAAAAWSPGVRNVTQAEFGDDWPLSAKAGVLRCQKVKLLGRMVEAVTFEGENRKLYNVNGAATSAGLGVEIEPIWQKAKPILVRDPQPPHKIVNAGPPKKDISPLIEAGLKLCKAQ